VGIRQRRAASPRSRSASRSTRTASSTSRPRTWAPGSGSRSGSPPVPASPRRHPAGDPDAEQNLADDQRKRELADIRNQRRGAHLHHREEPGGVCERASRRTTWPRSSRPRRAEGGPPVAGAGSHQGVPAAARGLGLPHRRRDLLVAGAGRGGGRLVLAGRRSRPSLAPASHGIRFATANDELREERLYEVLGIPRTASTEEIRTAFKRLAMEFHPDRNRGTSGRGPLQGGRRGLRRALRRGEAARYDHFGHGPQGFDPFSGFGRRRHHQRHLRGDLREVSAPTARPGAAPRSRPPLQPGARPRAGGLRDHVPHRDPASKRCETCTAAAPGRTHPRQCTACGGTGEVRCSRGSSPCRGPAASAAERER